MTFPSSGPSVQTTGNVAGGPYGAWSGTGTTALIGPAGSLVPIGGGGVALYDGANSITSGTAQFSNANGVSFGIAGQTITASAAGGGVALNAGANTISTGTAVFSNANGVTFGIVGQTITASVPAVGGAQTGISSIADSAHTQTVGMLSFANSNGMTFGLSTGANTGTLTASYTVPSTAGLISAINLSAGTTSTNASAFTFSNSNGLAFGLNGQTVTGSYTVPSTAGLISNLAVSGGAGNSNSVTGMTFQNSNGITFGVSTAANAASITASYTVPTVPALSAGVSNIGNTSGNTGTYSGQIVFAGGNNITLSVSSAAGGAQTVTISGANAGGAQTGISGIVLSNTTYTSGTVSFSNANGISFGSSAGQAITASYTVPATAGLISGLNVSGGAGNSQSNVTGMTFSNGNGLTFGVSTGANVVTVTGSYTVPTVPALSAGVSNIGNTAGNTGTYSGQVIFAGGNNITLSVSSAAGGAQTITISGANAGGAQTGISGIIVSNTTYISGTVSFSNANGISFGSSAGQAITASYTVPTSYVSNINGSSGAISLTVGSSLSSSTNGSTITFGLASNITTALQSAGAYLTTAAQSSASNVSVVYAATNNTGGGTATLSGGVSFSNANSLTFYTSAGNAVVASFSYTVPSTVGLISAINVSQGTTSQNVTQIDFVNSNNVSFILTTSPGGPFASVYGSYALNVSANGGTSNALSGLTFANSNGVSFGLSTGAGVGTITASVAPGGGGGVAISAAGSSQSAGTVVFSNSNGVSFGMNGSTITATVVPGAAAGIAAWANSNTTYTSGTVNLVEGGGAVTIASGANQSYLVSVPQTSSLVGVSGLNVSTNGSTISVYQTAMYDWEPWPIITSTAYSSHAPASWWVNHFSVGAPVAISNLNFVMSISAAAPSATSVASTGTLRYTYSKGVTIFSRQDYTNNSSNLSTVTTASFGLTAGLSYSSTSQSLVVSYVTNTTGGTTSFNTTSNSSGWVSFLSGAKQIQMPLVYTLQPGEYWFAHNHSSTTGTTQSNVTLMSWSQLHQAFPAINIGILGSTQTFASLGPPGIGDGIASAVTTNNTWAGSVISQQTRNLIYFIASNA